MSSSQGLRSTLETLRDPWGFFVDPTYFDEQGSVYSTALLDEALGRQGHLYANSRDVSAKACASTERQQVGEPWFSWAQLRVFGAEHSSCVSASPPTVTGDPGTDIPRYYAWADSSLRSGASKASVAAVAVPVITNAKGNRLPYVMWRTDQLEDLLDLRSTAQERPAAPPGALGGPDDLTELWGYTMRCQPRPGLCKEAQGIADEQVAVAAVSFPDDLSLAGALAILRARGSSGFADALAVGVEQRRADRVGLVRASRFAGTVDASFMVLQLVPEMYPGEHPDVTSAELQRRLPLIPSTSVAKRLRAIALLKHVDEKAWRSWSHEAQTAFAAYNGQVVTKSALRNYVDISETFGAMNLDAPSANLQIFPVNDAESEYLARLACANSWAFANGSEILTKYDDVRQRALVQAESPSEPVVSYVAGLQALNGSGITLTQEQRAAISRAVDKALLGCSVNGVFVNHLYRFNVASTSSCSLTITAQLARSSFGG